MEHDGAAGWFMAEGLEASKVDPSHVEPVTSIVIDTVR